MKKLKENMGIALIPMIIIIVIVIMAIGIGIFLLIKHNQENAIKNMTNSNISEEEIYENN